MSEEDPTELFDTENVVVCQFEKVVLDILAENIHSSFYLKQYKKLFSE